MDVETSSNSDVAWDPNSLEYTCCCGKIHVTTGARVIVVLESVLVGLVVVGGVVRLLALNSGAISAVINIVWALLLLLVVFILFQPIRKRISLYVLPHLIYQVIGIIFYFLLLVVTVVALASGSKWSLTAIGLSDDDSIYCSQYADKSQCNAINAHINDVNSLNSRLAGCIILLTSFSLLIGVQLWMFVVLRRFYRFLQRTESILNGISAAPYHGHDGSVNHGQSFDEHWSPSAYIIPRSHRIGYPTQLKPYQQSDSGHSLHWALGRQLTGLTALGTRNADKSRQQVEQAVRPVQHHDSSTSSQSQTTQVTIHSDHIGK